MSVDRGHHKVFLGMAAGHRQDLSHAPEGHAELEAGRDVVIGYLEPHGRAAIERVADGLPQLARRRVTYKDVTLSELDLPGLIERRPELALIDELAHTNAPGTEHAKRYEDVAEVLGERIDVFSTVNVQHLESLNDQVAELTGVRVRETFPDSVLSGADEVVLVDVTPPALIERLRAGKVYKPERVPAALNGFFRVENLAQRIVVAAASSRRHDGFSVDDTAWLLRNAPHEVVVLRPDPERIPPRGRAVSAPGARAATAA